jgi:glycerophosphoryl diester phosphodiesterase
MHYLLLFFYIFFTAKLSFAQTPLIIAHRGASGYEPENTLIAFETAIEMGTDIIETDVQQTKDSVLVLMHDLSVNRTTFGEGLIKENDFNWYKNLKIKHKDHLFKNPSPPSLD